MTVVHFNMVVEINKILKDHGIDYSIHADSGCTCAGLKLRKDGKDYNQDEIIRVINYYLYPKFMKVAIDKDNPDKLNVFSRFDT